MASVPQTLNANANALLTMTQQRDLEIRQQQDQREIGAEKNLRFKEKAVAEAASLLIAKKQSGWDSPPFSFHLQIQPRVPGHQNTF